MINNETTMSESIKNIAKAQASMQSELMDTKKDTKAFNYYYTNLDSLVKHLRPLLTKHGISFVQMPIGTIDTIGVETLYMHTSGEWIKSSIMSKVDVSGRNTKHYQSIGSAITYFRRYSLSAFVGIASDEDNDGVVGTKEISVTTTQLGKLSSLQEEARQKGLISINQIKDLNERKKDMNLEDYSSALTWLNELIVNNNHYENIKKEESKNE
jgi:hypothetical protein